ncbi:AAA family ATPase [Prochlorothrix hollandica]|uniref:Endonuclease GajA/Old nuclease/RecF-like AAA domain-containing protein n=1 Tax=Prochlorothrix hollandica PCC 9006 = CALU 1027 TaxID=317619 RepID=A0A0M2PT17_PROHO|nr:AAA family ATPase [Prochlorothrix hollandica]KKI99655.1 hypothetical protein PROH_07100 [Prochlorothrix hollandica PCC 9006 = CALU 1027]
MLSHYELTNFKAFGKTQTIPIRPITLLYGPNSAGKSSVLQSLLLLKQTLEDPENFESVLLPQGKLTHLGNYQELIHNHDLNSQFTVKAIFQPERQSTTQESQVDFEGKDTKNLSHGLGISFAYSQDSKKSEVIQIHLFQGNAQIPVISYKIDEESGILSLAQIDMRHQFWQSWWHDVQNKLIDVFFTQVRDALSGKIRLRPNQRKTLNTALRKQVKSLKSEMSQDDFDKNSALADLVDEMEYLIDLDQRLKTYTLPEAITDLLKVVPFYSYLEYQSFMPTALIIDEEDESLQWQWETKHLLQFHRTLGTLDLLDRLIKEASTQMRTFLTDLVYIAPLRDYPERLYTFSGHVNDQIGKTGKGIAELLFKKEDVLEHLNQNFEIFNLRYRVKIVKFLNEDDHQISDVFTIRLVDQFTNVDVSLLDVGFGISQILPVLVQSIASRQRTIAIEQPEIHLHPRLQGELADVFVKSALTENQNNFIIETHSENLLLRIMRRMRETVDGTLPPDYPPITPDQVCVLYVDFNSNGSASFIQELPLNHRGELVKAWPGGFFEEALEEVFA